MGANFDRWTVLKLLEVVSASKIIIKRMLVDMSLSTTHVNLQRKKKVVKLVISDKFKYNEQ